MTDAEKKTTTTNTKNYIHMINLVIVIQRLLDICLN